MIFKSINTYKTIMFHFIFPINLHMHLCWIHNNMLLLHALSFYVVDITFNFQPQYSKYIGSQMIACTRKCLSNLFFHSIPKILAYLVIKLHFFPYFSTNIIFLAFQKIKGVGAKGGEGVKFQYINFLAIKKTFIIFLNNTNQSPSI
jgi:hypothetical protein